MFNFLSNLASSFVPPSRSYPSSPSSPSPPSSSCNLMCTLQSLSQQLDPKVFNTLQTLVLEGKFSELHQVITDMKNPLLHSLADKAFESKRYDVNNNVILDIDNDHEEDENDHEDIEDESFVGGQPVYKKRKLSYNRYKNIRRKRNSSTRRQSTKPKRKVSKPKRTKRSKRSNTNQRKR